MAANLDSTILPSPPPPPPVVCPREPAVLLPELLRDNLDVVFVGIAMGRRSAARGEYYAEAGNLFWPTLDQVGITPRTFAPAEAARVCDLGVGFADLARGTHRAGGDTTAAGFDCAAFTSTLYRYQPRAIAFTGKNAASLWLRRSSPRINYGRQRRQAGDVCEIFVLPSTSAAARRYWRLEPWHGLADWLRVTAPWRF